MMRSGRDLFAIRIFCLCCFAQAVACASENGASQGAGGSAPGASGGQSGAATLGSGGSQSNAGGTQAASGGATAFGGISSAGGNVNAQGSGGSTAAGGANAGGNSEGGKFAGGASSSGGTTSGGSSTSGGATGSTSCTISAQASLSSKIASVGVVQFTTTLANPEKAQIDFGLDTNYGMTAPVDLTAPMYRTLLLGMKFQKTYHYRITVSGPSGQCRSEDQTIQTGATPSGLARITVKTNNAAALDGGFLVMGQFAQNVGPSGAPAYILDKDGEVVWVYNTGRDVAGARMTYDGKSIWLNAVNVPSGQASVHRVSMDGLKDEDLSSQFTGQSHQLTVLPDETVVFYSYGTGGCEDIKERSPSGTVKTIVNAGKAEGVSGGCHLNTVEYSKEDDTLIFSDLDHSNLTKIKRDGSVVWILNGTNNQFTGDGSSWNKQHGVHIIDPNHLLVFNNNGSGGALSGSRAIEVQLDAAAKSAKMLWSFTPSPAINNMIMGDVQRLSNGNTMVAYSTQGVLQEVSSKGEVLQELTWQAGAAFGYVQKRKSLYGPPPR